ncbi:hypothetical protein R6Q59_029780 [Mikania micrantha]
MISFGLVAKGGEPDAIVIAFGGTQETRGFFSLLALGTSILMAVLVFVLRVRWLLQWIGPKSHKQDIIKDLYTKNKANHAGLIRRVFHWMRITCPLLRQLWCKRDIIHASFLIGMVIETPPTQVAIFFLVCSVWLLW